MAPAMKAVKAMKAKAAMKSGVLTQTRVIASVAETNGLKNKQVTGVIEALFAVACAEIKKIGNFKLAGSLNLKLKKKPATPAKGHQSIHQGALRLQGQASLKDSEGTCHEEIEGGFELNFQMIARPGSFGGRSH
jgi:nucleoid DNA-binding protein